MREIFVFGSNMAGIHGAGSARAAFEKHGAIWGQGVGLQGNSYAIPTKDHQLQVLPVNEIYRHVIIFLDFAAKNPETTFNIVAIGCGLSGYNPVDIAPMFSDAPSNCILPPEFLEILDDL